MSDVTLQLSNELPMFPPLASVNFVYSSHYDSQSKLASRVSSTTVPGAFKFETQRPSRDLTFYGVPAMFSGFLILSVFQRS